MLLMKKKLAYMTNLGYSVHQRARVAMFDFDVYCAFALVSEAEKWVLHNEVKS